MITKNISKNQHVATFLLAALFLSSPLAATDHFWNDWSGGDGDWMDTSMWSKEAIPASDDYARFGTGDLSNVTLNSSQWVGRFYVWSDSKVNLTLGSDVALETATGFFQVQTGGDLTVFGPASGSMATVNVNIFQVGTIVTNGPSTLTFSGPLLRVDAGLNMGRAGDGNTIVLEDGVQMDSPGNLLIGAVADRSGGDNNHLTVTGAGTKLSIQSDSNIPVNVASRPYTVGRVGDVQQNNSFTISEGAHVEVDNLRTSTAGVDIGHGGFDKQHNWIEVTGAGSLLEIKGDFITTRIGRFNTTRNYDNYMSVNNGGTVKTEGTVEIFSEISDTSEELKNRLVIGAGGSFITSNTMSVVGGMLQLAEGADLIGEDFNDQTVPVDLTIDGTENSQGRFEVAGNGLGTSVTTIIGDRGVLAVGLAGDSVASALTLGSSVSMGHGSTVELSVFGPGEIDSIDLLVGAQLDLAPDTEGDGVTLSLLLNGYDPVAGDSFVAFSGETTAIVNSFAAFDLPALGGSLEWNTENFDEAGGWEISVVSTGLTFADWQADHFDEIEMEDESISGLNGNPAGDGVSNALKFALGLDPKEYGRGSLPVVATEIVEGDEYLTLTFDRPEDRVGVSYHVDASGDLEDWSELAVEGPSVPAEEGFVTVTYQDTQPVGDLVRRFLRLRVEVEL